MNLTERFIRYATINTQSAEAESIPSTTCQWDLIRVLEQDMKDLGISEVRVFEHGYVFGCIPATTEKDVPAIGFIAHMDTATEASGKGVKPRIVETYDGGTIVLNETLGISMDSEQFPILKQTIGKDLIVTDGTTLLGGDDKAGVTTILCAAEYLLQHPEIPHGKICIGFTPDEEVGRGPDMFDVEDFGAKFAYTVDGGLAAELQYENFNGATAEIEIRGNLIHPGEAKDKMVNAGLVAMEYNALLPAGQTPRDTSGYEGFFHLLHIEGDTGRAAMTYLIRDHSREIYERRKADMRAAAAAINEKYGEGTLEIRIRDAYSNMKEMVEPYPEILELAKKAMMANDVAPEIVPIRGGTDGARLSFMGLPCPNLGTGSANHHGPYEFAVIQEMEKVRDILVSIAAGAAE